MTGGGWLRLTDRQAPGAPQATEPQPPGDTGPLLFGAPGGALAPLLHTLRSTSWDGPAPVVGDLVVMGDLAIIRAVARGPGLGQWRLTIESVDRIEEDVQHVWRWRDD